jgi:hypothetical protein
MPLEENIGCKPVPPEVPPDEPGVEAGAIVGETRTGSPSPGVRLVLQPYAASDAESVSAINVLAALRRSVNLLFPNGLRILSPFASPMVIQSK